MGNWLPTRGVGAADAGCDSRRAIIAWDSANLHPAGANGRAYGHTNRRSPNGYTVPHTTAHSYQYAGDPLGYANRNTHRYPGWHTIASH
jgi:hypothetical protein